MMTLFWSMRGGEEAVLAEDRNSVITDEKSEISDQVSKNTLACKI
jgi:hypothetical protein